MKKKFLISGLVLFTGALAFTFSNKASNQDDPILFVDTDNIAYAGNWYCKQWPGSICNGMTGWKLVYIPDPSN